MKHHTTLKSLDINPNIYFFGTDEAIEQAERKEEEQAAAVSAGRIVSDIQRTVCRHGTSVEINTAAIDRRIGCTARTDRQSCAALDIHLGSGAFQVDTTTVGVSNVSYDVVIAALDDQRTAAGEVHTATHAVGRFVVGNSRIALQSQCTLTADPETACTNIR